MKQIKLHPLFHFFILFIFLSLFAFIPLSYSAHVYLSNGDQIRGNITSLSPKEIIISTPYSCKISVTLSHVTNLTTENYIVFDFPSGEKVTGEIESFSKGIIQIKSSLLGTVYIETKDLNNVEIQDLNKRLGKETLSSCNEFIEGTEYLNLKKIYGRGENKKSTEPGGKSSPSVGQPSSEDDIRKISVRQSSVLLSPKELEIEATLGYSKAESNLLFLKTSDRVFSSTFSFRTSFLNRLEGFIDLPVIYRHQEVTQSGSTDKSETVGIGDISAGCKYVLKRETDNWPEIIASAKLTTPTGKSPYHGNGNDVALGNGHWGIGPGINFIKTYDPVVIFGGLNYLHQFERTGLGQKIQPGDTYGYGLGSAFAVNENISFVTYFQGAYKTDTKSDGTELSGTSTEPISLQVGFTNRLSNKVYLEPSLIFGLTDDAPNFEVQLSFVKQFFK